MSLDPEACRTAHDLTPRAFTAYSRGSMRTIKFAAMGFTIRGPDGSDITARVDEACIRFLVSEAYSFGTDLEPLRTHGHNAIITVNWATFRPKDTGSIFSADVKIEYNRIRIIPYTLRVYYPNLPFLEFHKFLTAIWVQQR